MVAYERWSPREVHLHMYARHEENEQGSQEIMKTHMAVLVLPHHVNSMVVRHIHKIL